MDRQRTRNPITAGLLLIGIGILLLTGWWWPGIMIVLGIAIGAGLVFRNRYREGAVVAAIFFAIPLLTTADIPWNLFGPMILIGMGLVVLIKAFYLRCWPLSCMRSQTRSQPSSSWWASRRTTAPSRSSSASTGSRRWQSPPS